MVGPEHELPTREMGEVVAFVLASIVAVYAGGKIGLVLFWLGMTMEWMRR